MEMKSGLTSCEVCGNSSLLSVLDLGSHPLCDDLVEFNSNRECKLHPIEILLCPGCYTALQKYQVAKNDLFPTTYHYRSRFTADVLNGMEDLVKDVEGIFGSLNGKTVVDIGCNDGSLLDIFSQRGAITVGVEPTGAYLDANQKKHFVLNDYFTENIAKKLKEKYKKIDVITFTNVFAHIEDLPNLLKAVKHLFDDSTLLVIENHYLGSVLKNMQFDTFYHEHPRTYSLTSFTKIAEILNIGFVSLKFPSRYGGNIRVILQEGASLNSDQASNFNSVIENEKEFLRSFIDMNSFISIWKEAKQNEIHQLVKNEGKLIAKAFPGRAAILVTLLKLTENEIEVVYEKPGSPKIGHYVPGTKIPIRSDHELFKGVQKVNNILNLAWHIPSEIKKYLSDNNYNGNIISII